MMLVSVGLSSMATGGWFSATMPPAREGSADSEATVTAAWNSSSLSGLGSWPTLRFENVCGGTEEEK